jgi:hypothetical protein
MSKNIEISEFKFNIGCQVYGCRGRSAYRIGKHGLTTPDDLHICQGCLDELIDQIIPMIPIEKLPVIEKIVEVEKPVEKNYKGGIK